MKYRILAAIAASLLVFVSTADAKTRHHHHHHHGVRVAVVSTTSDTNSLVAEARKYIGTNPTGRGSLWCGAFLDMVLKRTGHRGGGNLARGYIKYGTRIAGPEVGAIVVFARQGGGHVGIVTDIDPHGNPIVISGNHNHRVAVSTYSAKRALAYVMPN